MPKAARARGDGPAPVLAGGGLESLSSLPGVGPRIAEKLAQRGLSTLQDLWLLLPLRYEDRTRVSAIAELRPGVPAQVDARIEAVERGFRWRPTLRVAVGDGSRATLVLRFFHFNRAQLAQFAPGRRLVAFGEPRSGQHGLEMVHPSYRLLADDAGTAIRDRLDPVYPTVEGLGPQSLARLVDEALKRLPPAEELELLPAGLRERLGLPTLRDALRVAHRPPPGTDVGEFARGEHPAQRRLALEELLAHHLSLRRQRIALRAHGAVPVRPAGRMASTLRLVQGDVGSGKTVVAALAAANAVECGRQVALMAPTELLAEQHLASFRAWLEPLGIEIAWLAGKVTGRARTATLARIAAGEAQVIVGTHALMQGGVAYAALGLAIVDEQHRFGVHQRLALRDKGLDGRHVPHQLVMTATPIPRTLAMSAYADLDVSVIDEMPPGRTPVQTVALSGERRAEVAGRIRAACAEGRQAYWVCTLIEDSEEVEAQAAQSTFEQLGALLPELRLGLLHGRMKPAAKQAVMARFKAGELQLLVATTVIEVGVDVPNASLMIIENAERLGLAQLHQLRGRVGRGAAASSCVLMFRPPLSAMARERLEVMRASTDGFLIAEKDLALRGPGELLGTRQTGLAQFRVADLVRDAALLPEVHAAADALLATRPDLAERLVQRWVGGAARFAGA